MSKPDDHIRMRRVPHFTTATGAKVFNTDRPLAPFRLMQNVGDYFEVEGDECIGGNLAQLASLYSRKLGRRFSFRTTKGARGLIVHRVTLTSISLIQPKKRAPKKRALFRVDHFFTPDGQRRENDDVDTYGRPAMYPFDLMRVGEYFHVEAAPNRLSSVRVAVSTHGKRSGTRFTVSSSPSNASMVTVTRVS